MYKTMIVLAFVVLGLSALQANEVAPATDAKPRKICRRSELTGTRMGSRTICRTADEWKRQDEVTEHMMDDLNDSRRRGGQNGFEITSKPL